MTERTAWRIVAEAFDTPAKDRTPAQRDLTDCGLCMAMCIALKLDSWHSFYMKMLHAGIAMGCGAGE